MKYELSRFDITGKLREITTGVGQASGNAWGKMMIEQVGKEDKRTIIPVMLFGEIATRTEQRVGVGTSVYVVGRVWAKAREHGDKTYHDIQLVADGVYVTPQEEPAVGGKPNPNYTGPQPDDDIPF